MLAALLLGAGAVLLGAVATAAIPPEQLWTSLEAVHNSLQYVLLAALILVLAMVMLVFAFRRGERVETLLQHGVLGEVRICFKAVENLVLKAARAVRGVRDLKTRIVHSEAGLLIYLRATTMPDINIPQVTAELQAAVKEYVESSTGSDVAEVRVMIENVVTDAVKAGR
jgi:uncharacterized alkaline shock family protein YloU